MVSADESKRAAGVADLYTFRLVQLLLLQVAAQNKRIAQLERQDALKARELDRLTARLSVEKL